MWRTQSHRVDLLPRVCWRRLHYVREREPALSVFLQDPKVQIDTNHLERGIQKIATGRRNWLFAWTEVAAQRIGNIQSLLTTCRLQGVDPYTYLEDVLQRVVRHPANRVLELTPRVWQTLFADNPLLSDLWQDPAHRQNNGVCLATGQIARLRLRNTSLSSIV